MPEDPATIKEFPHMSDLEKRVLAVLSVLENSGKLSDPGEYSLSDGRKIKSTSNGIRSFLKGGAQIETEKMRISLSQLLRTGLVRQKGECYFLSDMGKKLGGKFRKEKMSQGYDDLLSRTETSKAYSVFCERVFGKDLSQFNVLDMEQLSSLIDKLDLKPDEVALDLGCGNGRITEYISDLTGAKMVGLDFATRVIERAQCRTIDKRDRLTYVVGDMDDMRFREHSFDAIISIDTLYFVDDINKTIGELKNLLRPPNGRLAIFFDQSRDPGESRDVLLPENTKVGRALRGNGFTSLTIDFTANSKEIWVREIETAEQLKELFEKEGNIGIYEDRAQDSKRTLEKIESAKQVRHLYLARLEK